MFEWRKLHLVTTGKVLSMNLVEYSGSDALLHLQWNLVVMITSISQSQRLGKSQQRGKIFWWWGFFEE